MKYSKMQDTRAGSVSRIAQVGVLAWAALAGASAQPVLAGPDGASVVRGNVTFERDGNRTIIRASDGSIINYLNFDIGRLETVQFIQPGEWARVLNRINSNSPTMIEGRLLANGQVYLVNPAGVIFGNNSVVDVGGIYAAAGNISDKNFIRGKNLFTDLDGQVINYGDITGGNINLFGDSVANHGSIATGTGGLITMLAGDTVYISRVGDKVVVKIDGVKLTGQDAPHPGSVTPDMAADPGVENTGDIYANRAGIVLGAGDLYALAIRNTGDIHARRGNVTVAASDGLIHNTGLISASNPLGKAGDVTIQGPSILNEGAITADAAKGRAGNIEVTSDDHTLLMDGSLVSASGLNADAHGGNILIHSYNGRTRFMPGATVDVSGGTLGGHGGFVEVSAGQNLYFDGKVNLNALSDYNAGHLLIDPYDIAVQNVGFPDDGLILDDGSINFGEGDTTPGSTTYITPGALASIVGDITLEALGTIYIIDAVDLSLHNNNVFMYAGNNVDFAVGSAFVGANDLTIRANLNGNAPNSGFADVFISTPLYLTGNLDIDTGVGLIFHNGGSIFTEGTQIYRSGVDLCIDTELTASHTFFEKFINATFQDDRIASLTVNGPVDFNGAIGDTRPIRSLTLNGGPALMNGGLVITRDFQTYNASLELTNDLVTRSLLGATAPTGGDITFNGNIFGDPGYNLDVFTSATTFFNAQVGSDAEPLGRVMTDAPGNTRIGADMYGDYLDFNDFVALDNTVRMFASDRVDFAKTITGNGNSLIITTPFVSFHDDVTGINLLRTRDYGGLGLTTIGDPSYIGVRPVLISANGIDFNHDVELYSDAITTGRLFVDFKRRIDGPFLLVVNSDKLIHFGGDVGRLDLLESLVTNTPGLIRIHANYIYADQLIYFNPMGKDRVPLAATIAALGDGLRIEAFNGNVRMGPNEKLTLTRGDLNIFALNGYIQISDLNSRGDMNVNAPSIRIRAREAAELLEFRGFTIQDAGVDFVAGGSINFSVTPTVQGGSRSDVLFATASGTGFSDTLDGFERVKKSEFGSNIFKFRPVLAEIIVLDLTASARIIPPPPPPPTSNLAEALPDDPARISDFVPLDPYALRSMDRLAVYMRPMSDDELVATTTGRELYNDAPRSRPNQPADYTSVTNRLRREQVLAAINAYAELYNVDVTSGEVDEDAAAAQSQRIRTVMTDAWSAYTQQAGENADPAGFRNYLVESGENTEALTYLNELRNVLDSLRIMGGTTREYRVSKDQVLAPVTPENMDQAEFEKAIGSSEA